MDKIMNKAFGTLKKVIEDWGLFELMFAIILLPWSLIYIGFRFIQEWE